MKQAHSTEIDRLLRRHARRPNAAVSALHDVSRGNSVDDGSKMDERAHLDADEMNAYAEGVLLPAARMRLTAHLADCDSCRRMVTDLTLNAENVAAAQDSRAATTGDASPSKSWWSAITALFAPQVLRYAVPAVLLLGIIVVALVATRDRREKQFVAQQSEQKRADGVAPTTTGTSEPAVQVTPGEPTGTANTSATPPETVRPGTITEAPSTDGPSQANENAERTTSTQPTTGTPAPAEVPSNAGERQETLNDQRYENVPKAAPAPPVTSSPAPGDTLAKEKTTEEKEARKQNEIAASGRTDTAAEARSKDAKGRDDNASLAGGSAIDANKTPQSGARAATRSKKARREADRGADEDGTFGSSTETRSVGGRQFRRQGNAWIDTAYRSSRATINVARGSDQYRALVADEPGIRSIADQLGGEVIVVWKSKAYRIY